jgi:hypothetical protein
MADGRLRDTARLSFSRTANVGNMLEGRREQRFFVAQSPGRDLPFAGPHEMN